MAQRALKKKPTYSAIRWKPGMIAQVQTEQGPRHVVAAKVAHVHGRGGHH